MKLYVHYCLHAPTLVRVYTSCIYVAVERVRRGMAWADNLERSGAIAALRCANHSKAANRTAPRVAFCIAGAARSFAAPLVQKALRQHLIQAYGGDRTASRVFFLLKTRDSDKMHETQKGPSRLRYVSHMTNHEDIVAALHNWTDWIGEAVILKGSGAASVNDSSSSSSSTGQSTPRIGTALADGSSWKLYRPPHGCHQGSSTAGNSSSLRTGSNSNPSYLASGNNQERLITNALNMAWCRGAIARHEARSGRLFEVVVFARPDLLWTLPVLAWCQHRLHAVQSCLDGVCDAMWIAPRERATVLLSQAELHRDCPEGAAERAVRWQLSHHHTLASCCTNAEQLLWWSIRQSGAPVSFVLPPPGRTYAILRYVEGVCESALDTRFDSWIYNAKKNEVRQGAAPNLPT